MLDALRSVCETREGGGVCVCVGGGGVVLVDGDMRARSITTVPTCLTRELLGARNHLEINETVNQRINT